jgi:hypothetical protein
MGVSAVASVIGEGIAADVVGSAITGAVVSGVMGGDVGMGALTGGIGGGVMGAMGMGGGVLNYGNNSIGSIFGGAPTSSLISGAPGTTMGVDQLRQAVSAYDAVYPGMGAQMVAQATGSSVDAINGALAGLSSGITTAGQAAFAPVSSGALGGLLQGGKQSTLGTLGNVAQIGSGIYNMMNPPTSPEAAQKNADPWSQYRPQAATQLNQIMNNPNLVYGMPGYQFSQQQGAKEIERARAATGNLASGNTLATLNQFGQQNAQNWWNQYVNTLGTQAGVSNASLGVQANQFAQNKNDVSQTAALQNIMAGAVGLSQAGFFG